MTKKDIIYNNQTALNKIWSYAQTQEEPSQCASEGQGMACLYNSTTEVGEENHCWVGVLLEGIRLDERENCQGIGDLIATNKQVRIRLSGCDLRFLEACQEIHDLDESWTSDHNMYTKMLDYRNCRMRKVAEHFGLSIPNK